MKYYLLCFTESPKFLQNVTCKNICENQHIKRKKQQNKVLLEKKKKKKNFPAGNKPLPLVLCISLWTSLFPQLLGQNTTATANMQVLQAASPVPPVSAEEPLLAPLYHRAPFLLTMARLCLHFRKSLWKHSYPWRKNSQHKWSCWQILLLIFKYSWWKDHPPV